MTEPSQISSTTASSLKQSSLSGITAGSAAAKSCLQVRSIVAFAAFSKSVGVHADEGSVSITILSA